MRIPKKLKRAVHEFFGSAKYSKPAQFNMEDELLKFIPQRRGVFIEAGANDGYTQSNTYYLEKFLGWRGLLVEPITALAERCTKLRQNSHVINAALVSRHYDKATISLHFAGLMTIVNSSGAGFDKNEHIRQALSIHAASETYKFEAPTITLERAIFQAGLTHVDLLSLDIEGYEIEALGGMNWEKCRPSFILIESRNHKEICAALPQSYVLAASYDRGEYSDLLFRETLNKGQ